MPKKARQGRLNFENAHHAPRSRSKPFAPLRKIASATTARVGGYTFGQTIGEAIAGRIASSGEPGTTTGSKKAGRSSGEITAAEADKQRDIALANTDGIAVDDIEVGGGLEDIAARWPRDVIVEIPAQPGEEWEDVDFDIIRRPRGSRTDRRIEMIEEAIEGSLEFERNKDNVAYFASFRADPSLRIQQTYGDPQARLFQNVDGDWVELDVDVRYHEFRNGRDVSLSPEPGSFRVNYTQLWSEYRGDVPDALRVVNAGGYAYRFDEIGRVAEISGQLRLESGDRSYYMQHIAGGGDRIRGVDDGGHFIGVQFDGPKLWFNHFPQNSQVNQAGGAYYRMEQGWARDLAQDRSVFVRIRPEYSGNSSRPDRLIVNQRIGGIPDTRPIIVPNPVTWDN